MNGKKTKQNKTNLRLKFTNKEFKALILNMLKNLMENIAPLKKCVS